MLIPDFSAFDKIRSLVHTNLQKIKDISKPRFHFLWAMMEQWLGLPVRYTMLNLGRFGEYSEKAIRLQFEKPFDFLSFNKGMIRDNCGKELIAAFDPSFIPKSGDKTQGLGKYWSGKDSRALKGLEISVLAIVDVEAGTAMPLEAVQTPPRATLNGLDQNLVMHYTGIIKKRSAILKELVKYLVADGYFMKKEFILPVLKEGLHVITRMRPDSDLRYLPAGTAEKKRGRPKLYDGKVDCNKINAKHIQQFDQDQGYLYYSGIVYSVALKQRVRIVYMEDKKTKGHLIFLCTDTAIAPALIIKYYRLRFQIEFLIRDAKQHCGLEQCQARSKNKLDFHFNMSLCAVAVAKAALWLALPKEERGPFSMRNIKLLYYNKILAEKIISILALDLKCKKIHDLYLQCLDIATWAA